MKKGKKELPISPTYYDFATVFYYEYPCTVRKTVVFHGRPKGGPSQLKTDFLKSFRLPLSFYSNQLITDNPWVGMSSVSLPSTPIPSPPPSLSPPPSPPLLSSTSTLPEWNYSNSCARSIISDIF